MQASFFQEIIEWECEKSDNWYEWKQVSDKGCDVFQHQDPLNTELDTNSQEINTLNSLKITVCCIILVYTLEAYLLKADIAFLFIIRP